MSKGTVILSNDNTKVIINEIKKHKIISAHKIAALYKNDDYNTDFTVLLDLYRLLPFEANKFTESGQKLEEIMHKALHPTAKRFIRPQYGVTQFANKTYGGYVDAVDEEQSKLIEYKTVYSEAKNGVLDEAWKVQALAYIKLWNEAYENKLTQIEIPALYVPFKMIEYVLETKDLTLEQLIEKGCKLTIHKITPNEEEIKEIFEKVSSKVVNIIQNKKINFNGTIEIDYKQKLNETDIETLRTAQKSGLIKIIDERR